MRHYAALLVVFIFSFGANAQLWIDVQKPLTDEQVQASQKNRDRTSIPLTANARVVKLNRAELDPVTQASSGNKNSTPTFVMSVPLPNGQFANYRVSTSAVLPPQLAQKYPGIFTFKAVDIDNSGNTGRLDITPQGFHGMLHHGGETIFIDPIDVENNLYQVYRAKDFFESFAGNADHKPLQCKVPEHQHKSDKPSEPVAQKFSFGTDLRTYRIAIAATGEYTAFHGGSKPQALAAIVTAINRINSVFERDLAVSLQLVANNDAVIYTNAGSDPFTGDDKDLMIDEVGPILNSQFGVNGYDIGHVFSTDGGGLASLGVVCTTFKSNGVSGSTNPVNDLFLIDIVAHEIGHQFGANHSFNGTSVSCGGNRTASAAYEPGSGSTIMSYTGICGGENLQFASDDYFHTNSIQQMRHHVNGDGSACGTTSNLGNAVPVVNAGTGGTIPADTPFLLTGSATDSDPGDTLTYAWEQLDLGAPTNSQVSFVDDGSRPIFRSFAPTNSPQRMFPQLSDIATNTTTYGELLPTTDRGLNFELTVRDGNGGVASDSTVVNVVSTAGPFEVNFPQNATWLIGSTQSILWDVANTTAAPVSCANVEIALSSNGGQTFGTVLLASTPNDGNESIVVPATNITDGRIRVKCTNQPFFAMNIGTLIINNQGGTNNPPAANDDSFTVQENSAVTTLIVLDNDTDADNDLLDILFVENVSGPGTVEVSGGMRTIRYTPGLGFSGTETFDYTATDGNGGVDSATVTVTVEASTTNQDPVATNDAFTVTQAQSRTLGVIANDSDPDNDPITITAVTTPSNGGSVSIAVGATSLTYQSSNSFLGTETFNYTITDGNGRTSTATVTVTVTAPQGGGGGGGDSGGGGGGGAINLFILLMLISCVVFRGTTGQTVSRFICSRGINR